MIGYSSVYGAFSRHLGPNLKEIDYAGTPDDFLAHLAQGQVLSMLRAALGTEEKRVGAICALVTDLVRNGDDQVQNLVNVSFFENMDWATAEDLRAIESRFDPDVRDRMRKELKMAGTG